MVIKVFLFRLTLVLLNNKHRFKQFFVKIEEFEYLGTTLKIKSDWTKDRIVFVQTKRKKTFSFTY